eukprot:5544160-Pyramimonas_sp.AAC.3
MCVCACARVCGRVRVLLAKGIEGGFADSCDLNVTNGIASCQCLSAYLLSGCNGSQNRSHTRQRCLSLLITRHFGAEVNLNRSSAFLGTDGQLGGWGIKLFEDVPTDPLARPRAFPSISAHTPGRGSDGKPSANKPSMPPAFDRVTQRPKCCLIGTNMLTTCLT